MATTLPPARGTGDPIEALLDWLQAADVMDDLPRTGYVISRIPRPESLAAHSFGVANVAMALADVIDQGADVEKVLRMALLHDLPEAVTTDLPSPVKRFLGEATWQAMEAQAAKHLFDRLPRPIAERYAALWNEYEAGVSLEARIVKAADKLQMLVRVNAYERAGLGELGRFWEHPGNFHDYGLPVVAQLFAALVKRRGST